MRGRLSYLLLIILVLISCKEDEDLSIDSQPYSIILVAGQSNTNSGIGFDQEIDVPKPRIKQIGRFGENERRIVDAVEPLEHHTVQENQIGFSLTFSKLLIDYYNDDKDILIVPCGHGGTGFHDNRWNKGNDLYNDAINRVLMALSRNNESELIAILWHQGEKDVGNPNYENNLDDFIKSIREDLNAQEVPLIVGGMVPYWVDKKNERILQQLIIMNTVERHELVGYANPELPFRIEKPDNEFDQIHFDAEGQRELGKRYFYEFTKLVD